jgi:phosphoribosylaminoimidazolecarboxamide formyltransferase/IMP cyclohydrolase
VKIKIKSALLSVYHKDGLHDILKLLNKQGVTLYSTGGTADFIEQEGYDVIRVENITSYPSIFGGRVKTLHPSVMGGILYRRNNAQDLEEAAKYKIPNIDLVVVDLYPFEETLASGASEEDIIEKIDIGGISLIRAAAKNFKDVIIIPSKNQYSILQDILEKEQASTSLLKRKSLASMAFQVSSHYDTHIFNYFNADFKEPVFKQSIQEPKILRYGENPHQKGSFYGNLNEVFEILNGKELSYNNLLDFDAGYSLLQDFSTSQATVIILKHNNACGLACRKTLSEAYKDALAGNPVSAFGGVILCNREVDIDTATLLNDLFFEILSAPSYSKEALELLSQKKNRILLKTNTLALPQQQFKSALNGVLVQDRDTAVETVNELKTQTQKSPKLAEIQDLLFANKLVKHTKSNTIILAKNQQLIGSGTGQTSRVDALKQAIANAQAFGFDLKGAVMASDAFFPFPDCVEIAHQYGISAVIQPGGSIKDQASIDFCNANNMAMVFTGIRHFKH